MGKKKKTNRTRVSLELSERERNDACLSLSLCPPTKWMRAHDWEGDIATNELKKKRQTVRE